MDEIDYIVQRLEKLENTVYTSKPTTSEPVVMIPNVHTGKPKTAREEQSDFVLAVSHLIQFAYSLGYELTLGDAFRDPRAFGEYGVKRLYSAANSKHKQRLAIDLNLFKDGVYLTKTEDYQFMGDYWLKQYSPKSSWGGKWDDGNHFSWLEK